MFAKERLSRLGIPLVFGMLFIVPPQIYFERISNNQFTGNYFEYYTSMAEGRHKGGVKIHIIK